MYSVILCGGSGTRLWPMSRKNYPKQFLKLYSDKSLLQETYLRMREIMPAENIFFSTGKNDYFNVVSQIKEIEKNFNRDQVIAEPAARNTAPAITLCVKHLAEKVKIGLDAPVIFLPADHYIGKRKAYLELVKSAMENVGNFVGTIGVTPSHPETGYGYIRKGEKISNHFRILEFKEKPDAALAQNYINSGQYVWNSGMYLFSVRTFIRELRAHAPEIYRAMTKDYDSFLLEFEQLPSISVDYAISEKSDNVIVFEGEFGWSDIGSFDSLAKISSESQRSDQKYVGIDSKNIFARSDSGRLIATAGVENINIIDTVDSILVQKQGMGNESKKIVEKLKELDYKELEHNLIVHRPWGKYEVLLESPTHKAKRITVYPGEKLSLQAHYHRVEHWIVVKGIAKITHGEREIFLRENESTFIPTITKHRLENPGKINLEVIEVQTGNYLEEDDIIRYDDVYNRLA